MEDEIQSTPKTSLIVPVMAILGFGIAIIASAVGGIALTKISNASEEMNAKIEKNASIELEIKKINDRIDSIVSQFETLKSDNKVNELARQTQQVVNTLQANINAIRSEVVSNRESIEKLATRTVEKPVVKESKPDEQQPQQQEASKQNTDAKTHKIQSGDTFAKLAKKYGVSVDAIVKANPQANPSRLKIGQEIVIP
ncbi:MAG: LysM peptidoglycan-binding domain-containing protein [Verrucomicrobiaceae bacterium]|nr:LysM peptidoglycan-binding domain-containing protein [Verrucomicrobiaceae bacterium]